MLGVTTTIFESTPVYPDPSRYWKAVQQHKLTQFYTAPTAIRLLRKMGEHHVKNHDLSSLRTIGSVGEPIAPDAWMWYHEHVGAGECAIVDTYWQTETGSIIITPLPGATKTKPGSATLPFFGIDPVLLDPTTGKEIHEKGKAVEGVLAIRHPWPSVARTVYGDHARYLDTYLKPCGPSLLHFLWTLKTAQTRVTTSRATVPAWTRTATSGSEGVSTSKWAARKYPQPFSCFLQRHQRLGPSSLDRRDRGGAHSAPGCRRDRHRRRQRRHDRPGRRRLCLPQARVLLRQGGRLDQGADPASAQEHWAIRGAQEDRASGLANVSGAQIITGPGGRSSQD
jgi:hypothetical protein